MKINSLKSIIYKISTFAVLLILPFFVLANAPEGEHGKEEGGFNFKETLFHHVLETHNWHLVDIPAGDGKYTAVEIPLPWILYNSEKGLDVFMLSGHGHDVAASALEKGYILEHEHIKSAKEGVDVIDFSISKTVIQMMIIALLLILVFTSMAKAYKTNVGKAPKGLQSFLEPVVLFVRDDIAKPNLHGKHDRFMPYLLTLFFFIWFSNMFGLTPLNSNIMGNISVTFSLALLTALITNFNGTKDYWQHIFWFPGVPFFVKLIMLPVELVGLIIRPTALTIRLFANIAAGHFMVISLISLIFVFGKSGESVAGAVGILPLSMAFTLFIMLIEMLVAAIQAYVFVTLTCVFIGAALESHSHDDHHAPAHH